MTAAAHRPYRLIRPCPHCPFRNDITPYLRADRAREIAAAIRDGGEFHCHQTTVPDPDDDSAMTTDSGSAVCAGSLIVQEKSGAGLGQVTRIAERLGLYDRDRLDMAAPVYEGLSEWVAAVAAEDGETVPTVTTDDGEVLEFEHCNVVGPDCEDPSGYMTATGAAGNDDLPTCNPIEDCCNVCGSVGCSACLTEVDGEQLCVTCVEDGEDG